MFNLTETPTDYLETRRNFLRILINRLNSVRSNETDSYKSENLRNGLINTNQELISIENELLGRGILTTKSLFDGSIIIM